MIALLPRLVVALLPLVPALAPVGFEVQSVDVPEGSIWQVNRPIRIAFNRDIRFETVNLNTIPIVAASGAPAAGEFRLLGAREVEFRPACPTSADGAGAGFVPGGTSYTLRVLGLDSGGPTVLSLDGPGVGHTVTVHFATPTSTAPADLFFDTNRGGPRPVIGTDPARVDACYVEIGLDSSQRAYFAPRTPANPELGADVPAGFLAPLNLYSAVGTRVAVLVQINQSVDPSPANVSAANVLLEYLDAPGSWKSLSHTVQLEENCAPAGALLRVTPIGILPQGRLVRTVIASTLREITGETLPAPLVVGTFPVGVATDPGTTTPGDGADEIFEGFRAGASSPSSLEDTTTPLADPRALWGGDFLSANLGAFPGTGGPGGNFDWQIGNDLPQAQPPFTLDTTFAIITNVSQTATEAVVNGQVDVRNFVVKPNGTLVLEGPNPCRIAASGSVTINGKILVKGHNNLGVATINTTNLSELGAAGVAGGGRGGTGNPLTTQSSPAGGNGYGPFNTVDGGGGGGESGYSLLSEDARRPGGGGGGRFGHDVLIPIGIQGGYTNPNLCPDQTIIGLDVEKGFPGSPLGNGALHPGVQAAGGAKGPGPFQGNDVADDFWGTLRTQVNAFVHGELGQPSAGAGGGGGGNAIESSTFPNPNWTPTGDEKGAGGGGGGGSLTILALGNVVFGPTGRIDASGGTGGGGENSGAGGITRVGGGSGGGSGGHVVLMTAGKLDFTACTSTANPPGGIYASGGNGGAGRNDLGGAHGGGFPSTPNLDALPQDAYPSTNAATPCRVFNGTSGYSFTNSVGDTDPANVVICAGGDGGPGLIQLHAPTLNDILPPVGVGQTIFKIIRPPPVGSVPDSSPGSLTTINTPSSWDQLVPLFSRRSQAISKWIGLGAASVEPASPGSSPVRFLFNGTNTSTGLVQTIGSGSTAHVAALPPILSGNLAPAPFAPFVTADLRTVVFFGSWVTDDIYLRNPQLLLRYALEITHPGTTTVFGVVSASYDAGTGQLRLTVANSGMPLAPFAVGDLVQVRPLFFRVLSNGVGDALPDTSTIQLEFQAATANAAGDPDASGRSAWVADLALLDPNVGSNPDYRYLRFRVSFDASANGAPITPATPIPSLDFLRMPFRF